MLVAMVAGPAPLRGRSRARRPEVHPRRDRP